MDEQRPTYEGQLSHGGLALAKHPIDSDGRMNHKRNYCYRCGTTVKDQKFCHGCGRKLIWKAT